MSTHESHHLLPLLDSALVKGEWASSGLCLLLWCCSAAHAQITQASSKRSLQTRLLQRSVREANVGQDLFIQQRQETCKSPRPAEAALKTPWLQDLYMGVGNSIRTYTWMIYQRNLLQPLWQTACCNHDVLQHNLQDGHYTLSLPYCQ